MSAQAPTSPPTREPATVASDRPTAVRKDVTALFADLVGSTAFGEQVDPEAARSALAPYFEILRASIEDHAGTVAKFTGDGVMAVFGIPEIAEDDALRAVAAGAELQRRFRAFADSVRDRHGVELGLRVGINTGELVIGNDDADLVGDVLNTAARLEAACQPGRVLVGEDTWRLTRSSVTYEVLGEVRVKGKTDAIATFQVVDDQRGTTEDATPFVGRDEELTLLLDAFEQARSSPAAKLVTVIGAPGVGKTRLAAELRAAVDARSFDLRFERRGSTTFTPIAELLRELTGSASTDDVARLVAEHPESERLTGALSSFLGHGEARSTEESFWAVRRLLEHLAADEPLVIVVDDIQWAEPLFWDLLDHLVEWAAAPVLLVALARPELRELKPELTQPGRRVAASISLEGLDASTTRELAARLLETDELPGDLIDRLPASTEGNPLFIRELVQMLVDDGVLARSGDTWHLTIDVEAIEVPPTVLSLLASRVERLPDDERQVVELASVIGTEFDRGVLGSIAGDEVASRLGALIDRLRRKDLIEPSGTWSGDQPVYRFHHVLVRDAAYRRLLKAHRADLHEQVGRFLETGSGAADELDITVAHHYELVHRYRTELGTVDEVTADLAAQAAGRLQNAAELALEREDLVSAGGFAARAIELTADPAQLHELLLLGCEALLSSGDVTSGAPLVDQLQQQAGDERLGAWADCFRAELWSLTDADRLSEAADLSDAAANRLATLGDNAGVAKARLVRAATLARLGRVGDCEVELDLALGAARAAGDRRRTVAVLGAAPRAALFGPSPVARAGGRCLDVLRLLRITTSSQAVEATSIRCQGMLEALRGRFDSARDKFEVSRTTATELGHRQGLCETELFHGFAELLAGDAVEAEPHLRAARDGLGRLGIGADAGQASALLARSLLSQDRIDEAEELAREAVESAGQNLRTAIASRSVLAEIRAERGDFDDANRLIGEATDLVEGTDVLLEHAQTMLAAARVGRAADDRAAVQTATATAAELLAAKGVTAQLDGIEVGVDQESEDQVDEQQPPTSSQTGNRAWQLYSEMIDDWRATNDRGALISHFRHDFATVNHERLRPDEEPRDRDFLADLFMWATSFDNFDVQTEIVETRGDHLFLARWTITIDGEVIERRLIVETDDSHIVRYDSYELDDVAGVQVEFERRATGSRPLDREAEGAAVSAAPAANRAFMAALELQDAMLAQDRSAAERLFHPDVVVEIHSTMWASGGGPIALDRDIWLDQILLDSDVSETGSSSRLELIDMHGDGLCLYRAVLTSSDGHLTEGFFVDQVAQGLVTFGAVFDDEQFDEAAAELERLWTEAGPIDFDTPVGRVGFVFLDAWNAGDLPRARACMAPDPEIQSHRTVVTPGHTHGEEALNALFALHEFMPSLVSTPLEVRGDHLLLSRFEWSDRAGTDIEMLSVIQIGPGNRIRRTATFDPDDRAGAVALLEAWASEPPPAGLERLRQFGNDAAWDWVHGLRARAASGRANDSTNPTRLGWVFERLDDGVELIDHSVASAHIDGRDAVWAVWGELVDAGFDRTDGSVVAERGERFVLSSETLTSRDAVIERLTLVETDPGGQLVRVEVFDLDQEADALEMLDDRWFRSGDDRMNRASELVRDFGISLRTAGPEAAMELIDPDAVIEFRMHIAGGRRLTREEFVDNQVAVAEQGLATSTSVRAVAGPNLALLSASFADRETESKRWAVIESDGDRVVAIVSFDDDQVADARHELYRRWQAAGGPREYLQVRARMGAAIAAGDIDTARTCLDTHFRSRDHRQLGLGDRDREEWLQSIVDIIGPESGGHSLPVEAIDFNDGGLVYRHTIEAAADLGGPSWDVLSVVVVVDGLIKHWDNFDLDQLTEAHARFRELTQTSSGRETSGWDAVEGLFDTFIGRDTDRLRDFLAPDFTGASRERLSFQERTLDRDEWVEALLAFAQEGEITNPSLERVAERASTLFLSHTRADLDGNSVELLFLNEVVDGQITSSVIFGPDQLHEALDQLDRRWVELGGSAGFAEAHGRFRHVLARGAVDDLQEVIADDFVAVDHRALGLATRNRDSWIESVGEFVGRSTTITSRCLIVGNVELGSGSFVLDDGSVLVDGPAVIVLNERRQFSRMELFESDQLEAAHARFDEVVADERRQDHPFTNTAWQLTLELSEALNAGDTERVHNLLPGGFKYESRAPITAQEGDQAQAAELFAQTIDEGARIDSELVATRGDELALGRFVIDIDGFESIRYLLTHQRDGEFIADTWFGEDQLTEALDELDSQWGMISGSLETTQIYTDMRHAVISSDAEQVRQLLSDDFVAIDHRALGFGPRNADEWAASIVEWPASTETGQPSVRFVITYFAERTESVFLLSVLATIGVNEIEFWAVNQLAAGKLARHEVFDIDDLNGALARYHELASSSSNGAVTGRPPLENEATRIGDEVLAACEALDREALERLIHDDFESDWRFTADAAIGAEIGDKQQYIDLAITMPDSFADPDSGLATNRRVLAVRGDHLYLGRGKVTVNGYDWEYLVLAESQDGQYRRLIWWEPDRIAEAFVELDRRYYRSFGWDESHVLWRSAPLTYANSWLDEDPDLTDAIVESLSEFTDHRAIGFGSGDGDELRTIIETFDSTWRTEVPRFHRCSDRAVVFDRRATTGGEWENSAINVVSFDHDRIHTADIFDWNDLDAAIARFDELNERSSPRPERLSNSSTEAMRRVEAGWNAGELDIEADYEPDFVFAGRRASAPAVDGGRDVVTEMFTFWQQSGATLDMEVLAVRGERFCMYVGTLVTADQDRFEIVMVDELSESGRFARTNAYDLSQLSEANAELNRWYLESLGYGPDHFLTRLNTTEYRPDLLGPALHDEWVYVDHRNLGWPSVDKPTYLAGQLASVPENMAWLELEILRLSEQGIVQRQCLRSIDGDTKIEAIGVHVLRDEQIVRTEVFEVDDVDAALACFRELAEGEPVDKGAVTPPFSLTNELESGHSAVEAPANEASRLARVVAEAWERRDVHAARSVLSPDFQLSSRRRQRVGIAVDRDGFLGLIESTTANPDGLVSTHRVIEARGDHLVLFEATDAYGDDVVRQLSVIELVDGLLRTLTLFDLDQLDAAIALLDERWAANGKASLVVPTPDWSLKNLATIAFIDRLAPASGPDTDHATAAALLRAVYHEDLVYEIHRRGVHGQSGGRDAAIEGHFSWAEVGLRPVAGPIEVRGEHLALLGVMFVSDDHADEVGIWVVVEADDDERITYLGVWDDVDLDVARTELDRRSTGSD